MKVLLPIDESRYSQEAVGFLLRQMQKRGTRVRVLHVIEPVVAYVTAGMIPQLVRSVAGVERDRQREARALVTRTAQQLRRAGLKATTAVEKGDPKTTIIDHAAKWGAELIILGSHGLKGMSRFLMGSVSDAVLRHARCSVEVVRPRSARKRARQRKR